MDWALAATVAAGALLQQRGCDCQQDPLLLNIALTLLTTLPIGLRRRQPVAVLLVVGAASIGHLAFGFSNQFLNTFAALVAMFSVACYAPWAVSVLLAAATALILPLNFLIDWSNHHRVALSDVPYNYGLFGAAWILGDNLRREREVARREQQLRAVQEERARRAVADERSRIARDLHDAVAHTLSVIVLQAGAARRIATEQPARARDVLGSIEVAGREAGADMRRLVGILRTDDELEAETEPQPSLQRLEPLVERVRATGLTVDVTIEGEPQSLPQGVDLSAYRIVQEALTNVLRHAGAGRAGVAVRYGEAQLEIEVVDDGRGPAANGQGTGHGLVGMRERVAMFGGRLETGPSAPHGFRVHAVLPIEGRRA